MSEQHTPGPWRFIEKTHTKSHSDEEHAYLHLRFGHGSHEVCGFFRRPDANLIAAAPELLQLARDLFEQVQDEWPGSALTERAEQFLAKFE